MNANFQYNTPYYYNQGLAALNGAPSAAGGQQAPPLALPLAQLAPPLAAQLAAAGQGEYYRYPLYPNYYQQPTAQQYYTNGAATAATAATGAPGAPGAPTAGAVGATGATPIADTLNAASLLTVGQYQPPGIRPRVTTTMWEDEKTLCYQVDANNVSVVRRADNNMINGTKLLNVAQMTRGRRDGILKLEKVRHVVKIGLMHLKGVWIPFERALAMAQREGIVDLLYPLFVRDIKRVIQTGVTPNAAATVKALLLTPPTQAAQYYLGAATGAPGTAGAPGAPGASGAHTAGAPTGANPTGANPATGAAPAPLDYALYASAAPQHNGTLSHQLPQQAQALALDTMKMYQYNQQMSQQQQPYYLNLYYQQQPYGALALAAPLYLAYPQGAQMYGYYGQLPQQPQQPQQPSAPLAHTSQATPQQPALATPQAAQGTPQPQPLATPNPGASDVKDDDK